MTNEAATSSDWDPNRYRTQHAFVYQFGESLVDLLAPQAGERILDLGCGTGELTAIIAATGAEVQGMDQSPAMITAARARFPELEFRVGDAGQFTLSEPVDALFSNATLHWVLEVDAAIGAMYRAIRPGGRLVLEMGAKENIATIQQQLQATLLKAGFTARAQASPWYFPSLGTYCQALERAGFRIQAAWEFDRPTQLDNADSGIIDWLRQFAGWYFRGVPAERQVELCHTVQEAVRPQLFRTGQWYADYRRLRIQAVRDH